MTREALREGNISTEGIKSSLTDAKGDLFVSASLLGCTTLELTRYIRSSEELQAFAAAIETVRLDSNFNRMSIRQFEEAIESRILPYRIDALDSLHELATMRIDSAAMAKVKFEASRHLHGGSTTGANGHEVDALMHELNTLYTQNAPMIKEIRQSMSIEQTVHKSIE